MMENTTVVGAGLIQVTGKLVIKNLVGVIAGFEQGKFIESEKFMLGDNPLTIKVYPNGNAKEGSKGHVGIFVTNEGDADISVNCQIITDVETCTFDYNLPIKAGLSCGCPTFLTHAECTDAYTN